MLFACTSRSVIKNIIKYFYLGGGEIENTQTKTQQQNNKKPPPNSRNNPTKVCI